ncbi:MAG: molybdenum cofactor biosynthesis protein MoaE [Anaerolineae bacterium]
MERFAITTEPLSVEEIVEALKAPTVGGITTFVGVVRGETAGRRTRYLVYEAYPEMAVEQLQRIGAEIRERWPTVCDVSIVHRIGRLEVGETIVVIALAAAHRAELFDATHYAIDRLKEIVPIWQKEVWEDGEAWKSGD